MERRLFVGLGGNNRKEAIMTQLSNNTLQLGDITIDFQRTLRIPDDGKRYPLPPGLGRFPLRRVEDYADRVPADWTKHGGVFLPMYQREALWLRFGASPHALKIGVGKVCAISGERWSQGLRKKPQNYVVTGAQPWLDGIATGKGTIRQFVAMPLGLGYTVEGQVTGEETHGGIQLQAYAPKPGAIPSRRVKRARSAPSLGAPSAPPACVPQSAAGAVMGIAAGGSMVQKIYPDPHGIQTWDQENGERVFVHLVNGHLWHEITGEEAPKSPVTAKSYARAGLPWFELYDEGAAALDGTHELSQVQSIKTLDANKSTQPLQDDSSVKAKTALLFHKLGKLVGVQDGEW